MHYQSTLLVFKLSLQTQIPKPEAAHLSLFYSIHLVLGIPQIRYSASAYYSFPSLSTRPKIHHLMYGGIMLPLKGKSFILEWGLTWAVKVVWPAGHLSGCGGGNGRTAVSRQLCSTHTPSTLSYPTTIYLPLPSDQTIIINFCLSLFSLGLIPATPIFKQLNFQVISKFIINNDLLSL